MMLQEVQVHLLFELRVFYAFSILLLSSGSRPGSSPIGAIILIRFSFFIVFSPLEASSHLYRTLYCKDQSHADQYRTPEHDI